MAVRVPDKESSHAPGFFSKFVHDLGPGGSGGMVARVDVVDLDGRDWDDRGSRIMGHDAQLRFGSVRPTRFALTCQSRAAMAPS